MEIGYMYDFEAYPPRGGNHVHAMELTQGFIREGHSVHVVGDPTMPGVTCFGADEKALREFIESIDVLYVRIDARYTRFWEELRICFSMLNGLPVVWEINSPANEALAYSWLGGRSVMVREGPVRRLKRFIHAAMKVPGIYLEEVFRKKLARKVSAAVCVSASLSRYAAEDLSIRDALTLPNGGQLMTESEIRRRRENRHFEGFTVLYTGSAMYPWQGLDYLAEVITLAQVEVPDICFVLAVNQRVPDLPETDNVIVLEHLNRDEILDTICSSDACVSLHPEYPWSRYGFHNSPMKMFEYMACMRPVVTSNHGQMSEIINDGRDGLLTGNTPAEILSKLCYLRDNPDHAENIGRAAWQRVQSELNWQHNTRQTIKVFENAIECVKCVK